MVKLVRIDLPWIWNVKIENNNWDFVTVPVPIRVDVGEETAAVVGGLSKLTTSWL